MKRIIVIFIFLILLAALAFGLYTLVMQKRSQEMFVPIPGEATTTDETAATSTATTTITIPTATTTPVSWKTYTNNIAGYSISYPPDLYVNSDGLTLVLTLPKDKYFRWPLQDDVKITVTASSTCMSLSDSGFPGESVASTTFSLNGYSWTLSEGSDIAAGNIYRGVAYDAVSAGTCYHIELFDHGANGAGLYVDDQSLISRYNAEHDADLSALMAIGNIMVSSFHVK